MMRQSLLRASFRSVPIRQNPTRSSSSLAGGSFRLPVQRGTSTTRGSWLRPHERHFPLRFADQRRWAGHSKWSNIRHTKGAKDAARAKLFTRLSYELTNLARHGGTDLETNPALKTCIEKAKQASFPKDKIEKAIKKAESGPTDSDVSERVYEVFGPGGAAILVKTLSDNGNRIFREIRAIANKHDGNIGKEGAVRRLFEKRQVALVVFDTMHHMIEKLADLMDAALEANAEDIDVIDSGHADQATVMSIVLEDPDQIDVLVDQLKLREISVNDVQIDELIAVNKMELEDEELEKLLELTEDLRSHPEVHWLSHNVAEPGSSIEDLLGDESAAADEAAK